MAARTEFPVATSQAVPDIFEPLEILFRHQDATYWAEVTASPLGPKPAVEIDAQSLELTHGSTPASSLAGQGGVRRRATDTRALRYQGEQLFRALFTRQVAEVFRAAVVKVQSQGRGLQIRLLFDDAPRLGLLPWEAMWDPETGAFLADQAHLPIVRAMRETPKETSKRIEEPMRLVALLPEPKRRAKLSGDDEWRDIETALKDSIGQGRVTMQRLESQTLDSLKRCFDEGRCDVLHIVAHGGEGRAGEGGLLKLEDAFGEEKKVTGLELTRVMERRTKPQLVLLNTCHGGRAAAHDALDGMAQHLIRRGVTAVVAMRRSISDGAALAFAQSFYRELAKGVCVEAAMVEARRALAAGQHRMEWAIPALYLRGHTVRILPKPAPTLAMRYSDWRLQTLKATPQKRSAWLFLIPLVICLSWLVQSFLAPDEPQDAGQSANLSLAALPDGNSKDALGSSRATVSSNCPSPLGLEDLQFVEIQPDIQDVGDAKLIVVDAFCIGAKEVSRRDWLQVMGPDTPLPRGLEGWPITEVTLQQAREFTKKLSLREPGVGYRLPTATEWEFAARADSLDAYSFGNDESELHKHGNCRNYWARDGYDGPAPIGKFKPNSWGLYDVHGNVAEWVEQSKEVVPSENPGPTGEISLEPKKAIRLGGSFESQPESCAFGKERPVLAEIEDRGDTGFRVVRELE